MTRVVAVEIVPAGQVPCATPSRRGRHGADWTVTTSTEIGSATCSWCDKHLPDRYRSEVSS